MLPTPGPLELVIILVIALLILGPGKLPDVGAALGRSIREFRKASSDIQDATRIDGGPAGRSTTTPASPAATTPTTSAPADPSMAAHTAQPGVGAPGTSPADTRSEPSTEPKP